MWYLGGAYGVLHGTLGVFRGSCLGTSGLLEGHADGASGTLHARKGAKLEGFASALEGYSAGYHCRGGLGGILYCGALDAAHSRGLYAVLTDYSGGTLGGYSRGTVGPFGGILGAR